MLEWDAGDDHIRVVDANNTELTVAGADLTVGDRAPTVPRPVDTTLEVRTRELRFPHAVVCAFSLDADEQYELDPSGDSLSLSRTSSSSTSTPRSRPTAGSTAARRSTGPTTSRMSSSPFPIAGA